MTDWTILKTERLVVMWKDGSSAREIGNELGFSRNAVIGKVHRIAEANGLEHRKPRVRSIRPTSLTDAIRKAPRRPYLRPAGNGPPFTQLKACPEWRTEKMHDAPVPKMLQLFEMEEHQCRWPIGDPGRPNFGFCAHDKKDGSVYCPYHDRIAYAPRPHRGPAQRAA